MQWSWNSIYNVSKFSLGILQIKQIVFSSSLISDFYRISAKVWIIIPVIIAVIIKFIKRT